MGTINSQNFQSILVKKQQAFTGEITDLNINVNFFNGISYKSKQVVKPTKMDVVLCFDGTDYTTSEYITNCSSIMQALRDLVNNEGIDLKVASPFVGWINPGTGKRIYKRLASDETFVLNECLGYFPNYDWDSNSTTSYPFKIINEDRFYNQAYWNPNDFIISNIEYFPPKIPFNRALIGMSKAVLDPLYFADKGSYPIDDDERADWLYRVDFKYTEHLDKCFFTHTTHPTITYDDVWTDPQSFENWQTNNGWLALPNFVNLCDLYELKWVNPFNALANSSDFFEVAKREGSQLVYIMVGKNHDGYYSSWFDEMFESVNKNITTIYFTESY